jgi:sugar phosphate isomerase/epimerase
MRRCALDFVTGIIDVAGQFGASAIIGSMQGRANTLELLRESLEALGDHATHYGVPLIYEPLNRYATNLVNTIGAGVDLISSLSTTNVRLLADLFHMNIEEVDLPAAIRTGGRFIGHVHLADSNRRPAGGGHTDFVKVARALRDIGYDGYVSAEALPYPDSQSAARATMDTFNRCFRS